MKKIALLLVLLFSLVALEGCALDKYATYLNFKNVERIVEENETNMMDSDLTEAQKLARKKRNAEGLDLAKELAIEAGNTPEDLGTEPPVE